MNSMPFILKLTAIAALFFSFAAASEEKNEGVFSVYVDERGAIARPTDFRENWVHLGSFFVPEDEHARGPGVHDVYAEPAAVETYRETGAWPDGGVLVKEIRSIVTEEMTTGTASFAGEPLVWFVMIKDQERRFSDNAIWGEGWGWALFESDRPSVNVNENWKQGDLGDCYTCHLPAEETDWVFIEGYPTLR